MRQCQLQINRASVQIPGSRRSICSVIIRFTQIELASGNILRQTTMHNVHSTIDGDGLLMKPKNVVVVNVVKVVKCSGKCAHVIGNTNVLELVPG